MSEMTDWERDLQLKKAVEEMMKSCAATKPEPVTAEPDSGVAALRAEPEDIRAERRRMELEADAETPESVTPTEPEPEGVLESIGAKVEGGERNQADQEAGKEPTPESDEALLDRLAGLPPVEYDRLRDETAKRMGIRVGTLDTQVKERRQGTQATDGMVFADVEPWPEAVGGDELLSGLVATFKRFIVGKEETMIAAALWVAMTWFIDIVHVAPLAVITAPDKRCGKSQLLAIMGKMVCRPLLASNVSSAALFRVIEAWRPTFLIDETDAFMKDNEELRGILNSGHTRDSAYVIRTVGDDHIPRRFSTWGAKALAGIGKLADTLMDRSIILEMRRKLRTEKIEKLRHAGRDLFSDQARKLARFASDNGDTMRLARPEIPASMNDRAQDNWEPLLAIADIAGGVWPKKARAAAVAISCGGEETASIGNELLADIQNVFEANRTDRIGTAELIKALCEDEEAPWNTYNRGKQISPRQMANRLKEYGVVSKTIRIGFQTAKGYELSQFDEAFSRYISPSSPGTPVSIRNSVTNHVNHSICNSYVVTDRAGTTAQSGLSVTPQIIENKELNPKCYVVTDRGADTEGYEEVVI